MWLLLSIHSPIPGQERLSAEWKDLVGEWCVSRNDFLADMVMSTV